MKLGRMKIAKDNNTIQILSQKIFKRNKSTFVESLKKKQFYIQGVNEGFTVDAKRV